MRFRVVRGTERLGEADLTREPTRSELARLPGFPVGFRGPFFPSPAHAWYAALCRPGAAGEGHAATTAHMLRVWELRLTLTTLAGRALDLPPVLLFDHSPAEVQPDSQGSSSVGQPRPLREAMVIVPSGFPDPEHWEQVAAI